MARRKRTMVDGQIIEDEGGSIQSALDTAGRQGVSHVISGGELITAEDFNRPPPAHDMITNQTPMSKGATTLRDYLLNKEFDLITNRFLGEFPGKARSLELDDNTLLIRAFPLPDDYTPDHIDLLFVIKGYYERPPLGAHIPTNCPQREQIAKQLDGHVDSYIPESDLEFVKQHPEFGTSRICFHYKNLNWTLKPNNLLAGDCLFKFIENIYLALAGKYR